MKLHSYYPVLFRKNKTGLPILLLAMLAGLLSACSTPKNSFYFKSLPRDTSINTFVNKSGESKIRKNDQLGIAISSLNPQEDLVFNAAALTIGGAAAGGSNSGYLVDVEGKIQLHRLGSLPVEGMTRRELKNKLESELKPYLKDPVVTVRFLNRRITVLGEVSKPQVINMPEEKLTLLEVLGSSGDVSPLARKDNILIIRETEQGKQFKRINMEDHAFLGSEWYYLQPDDVVFVEPNDEKVRQAKRAQNQQNISLILSGVTVAVILLDRLLR